MRRPARRWTHGDLHEADFRGQNVTMINDADTARAAMRCMKRWMITMMRSTCFPILTWRRKSSNSLTSAVVFQETLFAV